MPTVHLGRGNDVFVIRDDDTIVYGQAGNDSIEGSGSRLFVDGGSGADRIRWLSGNDIAAQGGLGNDVVNVAGRDNLLSGGPGDDNLRAEGQNDTVLGGAGNDTINAGYGSELLALGGVGDDSMTGACSDSELYGGAGNDIVRLAEGSNNGLYGGVGNDTLSSSTLDSHNNTLQGGAGNDTLIARDSRNVLEGGSGNDRLSSIIHNWIHEVGDGTTLTGGSGTDSYYFENPLHLSVTNDANSVLSAGDVIAGGIDQITDYRAGETIDLFGDGYNRVASVRLGLEGLDDDPPGTGTDHKHADIDAQEYVVLRGHLTAAGTFTVSDSGDDTIIVYGADYGSGEWSTGAVVLENYTGDILIV